MKKVIATCVLIMLILPAMAQTEFSLYRLNATLPQSNMLNPAFYPNSRLVIGLPVISSVYFSVDNDRLSFRDFFKTSESDSLEVDTLALFSKLRDEQRMKFKEAVQLFYFGLRGRRSYFSLGIHQVSETRFNYPGDLIGWAIRGPGHPAYVGKPLDFGNFYGRSVVYGQLSVNYSRELTQKLRIGARFNYLVGVATGETTQLEGKLLVSTDSVNISTGQIKVQTAGIDFFDQDNLSVSDYKDYFLKGKNKGMSWDVGATYNVTDRLMLSAAVNDLGYIKWEDYTRSYDVDPINYTFRGFDMLDYLNSSSGDEFLESEVDSLESLFNSSETTGNKFRTSLVGKFYAGVNYRILKVNNFSALVYFDLFQKRIDPALSLGYNLQIGRFLNATVGLTYQNSQITNVGAGLALKLVNLQIYATSDRANSFAYPARASRADAHFGANLIFGKMKKKGKIDEKEEEKKKKKEEPAEEPKEEPMKEEPAPLAEPPKDTVTQAPPVIEPVVDTTRAEAPVIEKQPEPIVEQQPEPLIEKPVEEVKKEEPQPVVEEPVAQPVQERHEVVKKGWHRDELNASHYVIVGVFQERANAERHSRDLKAAGFKNEFGFVTQKRVYYVYVFKSADLEETRGTRDQFRKFSDFDFENSWVLTVLD